MTQVYDYVSGVKTAAVKSYIAATNDYSSKWDISVGGAGNTAAIAFDGQNRQFSLTLPPMPLDGVLTRQEVERLTGYWLHEVLGHAVQTDFAAWAEACRLGLAQEVNALEDVRIELGICSNPHYPNAKHYLEKLVESIAYQAQKDGMIWDTPAALLSTIAYIGRVEIIGYNVPSLPAFTSLNPNLQSLLSEIFKEIKKCRAGKSGTWDVLEIAKRLRNAFNQLNQQTRQQQKQSQAQSGGKGEKSDSTASAGGGDKAETEPQDGDSKAPATAADQTGDKPQDDSKGSGGESEDGAEGDNQSGGDSGNSGQSDGNKSQNQTGGKGATKAYDNMIGIAPKDISKRFGVHVKDRNSPQSNAQHSSHIISRWQGEFEAVLKPIDPNYRDAYAVNQLDYAGLKSRLTGSAKLRMDIKNFVSAPERVSFERYLESGRLDTRLAAKIRAGSTRVFKRRQEDEGQNAAVMFLMDVSPSMRCGGRDVSATVLAIHMAEAVEQAGSPVCVAAFCDPTQNAQGHIKIAKPFNKQIRACADRVANLAHYKSRGTNLSANIITAAKRLKAVNATRHILFVLTDGACGYGVDVSYKAAQIAENLGVEVIGFGVGVNVSHAFPHAFSVSDDMSDIAKTGLSLMAKQLKAKRAA